MQKIWSWVAIILVSICLIILVGGVRSEKAAYQAARRSMVVRTAQQTQTQMPPGHWLLIRRIPRP